MDNSMGSKPSQQKKKDAVDTFIDEFLMKNKDVNFSAMPDFMEKDIYRNLLRVVIGNLTEILKSCRFQILNHIITIHIEPITTEE